MEMTWNKFLITIGLGVAGYWLLGKMNIYDERSDRKSLRGLRLSRRRR